MVIAGAICAVGCSYRLYEAVRSKRAWRSYEYFDRPTQPLDYWLVALTRPVGILLGFVLLIGGFSSLMGTHP